MVLIISLIVSTLAILHVIFGYLNTPPGMVYMATGHYYLDYFQYVQSFAQGIQGKWLLDNPLTLEDTPKTFIGMWQNLILGKIAGIFGLSPVGAYWFFTFLFLVIFILLIFKLINKLMKGESYGKKIAVFVLALFSAPFYEIYKSGKFWDLNYYAFWSDKGVLWKRFESIPYHLTANILTLAVLLLFISIMEKIKILTAKELILKALGVSAILFFLLSFSPSSAVLLSATIGVFNLILFVKNFYQRKKDIYLKIFIFTFIVIMFVLPAAILIRISLENSYYKIAFDFEKNWQIKLGFKQFFLVHGPLSVLALLGIKKYFNNFSYAKAVFFIFIVLSYLIFFSPLALILNTTNTRFLTSLSYVFLAILSLIWIKDTKKAVLLAIVLFLFFLPVNVKAFSNIMNDKNIFSPVTYLPEGIIEGFKFLGARKEEGNVLLTPSQFLGTVLPIYADRKVYVARHNITLNYMDKNITASNFYLHYMDDKQALEFLNKNNLKFVVFTSIEGYDLKALYKYSFLKEIYKNKDIVIFEIK